MKWFITTLIRAIILLLLFYAIFHEVKISVNDKVYVIRID